MNSRDALNLFTQFFFFYQIRCKVQYPVWKGEMILKHQRMYSVQLNNYNKMKITMELSFIHIGVFDQQKQSYLINREIIRFPGGSIFVELLGSSQSRINILHELTNLGYEVIFPLQVEGNTRNCVPRNNGLINGGLHQAMVADVLVS